MSRHSQKPARGLRNGRERRIGGLDVQPKLLHFLLVEDDDDHATILIRTLRQNRIANTIDRVADGANALTYLRREGESSN